MPVDLIVKAEGGRARKIKHHKAKQHGYRGILDKLSGCPAGCPAVQSGCWFSGLAVRSGCPVVFLVSVCVRLSGLVDPLSSSG